MLKNTSKLTDGYWRRRLISLLSEIVGVGSILVVRKNVLALDLASLRVVAQEHLVDFLDIVLGESGANAPILLHVETLVKSRRRCGDW